MSTSRRPFVCANWKMHHTTAIARSFAATIRARLGIVKQIDSAIAPAYPMLLPLAEALAGSGIGLVGQAIYPGEQGAFTGAVSGPMLKDVGCSFVLIGHSERRQLFGETIAQTALAVQAALQHQLQPILCLGESQAEREQGQTEQVLQAQLKGALAKLTPEQMQTVVLAYEPVWAIGTGKVATPELAQATHSQLRAMVEQLCPGSAASMRILYGGSVKPDNLASLLAMADIDGALVGGASLQPESFAAMVDIAQESL